MTSGRGATNGTEEMGIWGREKKGSGGYAILYTSRFLVTQLTAIYVTWFGKGLIEVGPHPLIVLIIIL